MKTDDAPRFEIGSARAATLKRTAWLGGSVGHQFKISVPLEDKPAPMAGDEEDDDRGEPPPGPARGLAPSVSEGARPRCATTRSRSPARTRTSPGASAW